VSLRLNANHVDGGIVKNGQLRGVCVGRIDRARLAAGVQGRVDGDRGFVGGQRGVGLHIGDANGAYFARVSIKLIFAFRAGIRAIGLCCTGLSAQKPGLLKTQI